jgi:hypothetical protein
MRLVPAATIMAPTIARRAARSHGEQFCVVEREHVEPP